jgi:hypothetical protein
MLKKRHEHCSVYFDGFVYVIGGDIHTCERFSETEGSWQALNPYPGRARRASCIVLDRGLYVLGGASPTSLNSIQKLDLTSLTWEVLEVKLPYLTSGIPCFKLSPNAPQFFFVIEMTLYTFKASSSTVHRVKVLGQDINSLFGPSYYSKGVLYCSSCYGDATSLEIGSLD